MKQARLDMFAIFGERQMAQEPRGSSTSDSRAFAAIVRGARAQGPIGSDARERQIERLIAANAWTDAALALIDAELKSWHVRRLVRDGSDWVCSLSRFPRMPDELDIVVDGRDPSLPLAILDALAEAQRRSVGPDSRGGVTAGRQVRQRPEDVMR